MKTTRTYPLIRLVRAVVSAPAQPRPTEWIDVRFTRAPLARIA